MKITNFKLAIIFIVILLICVIWIAVQNIAGDLQAQIIVDGEVVEIIDSLENENIKKIKIETEFGYNYICYGQGSIWIEQSDCENQTCVNFGKADRAGQVIICAPHKLAVKIVSEKPTADAEV